MKHLLSTKPILAVAVALGSLAAASAVHARPEVVVSIGVHAPLGHVRPAPVHVQPRPVHVQPPVHYGVNSHHASRSHEGRRGPWGDADHDGVPNRYDRNFGSYDGHGAHRAGGRGDRDRDGVPNRYDRAPGNPYRY